MGDAFQLNQMQLLQKSLLVTLTVVAVLDVVSISMVADIFSSVLILTRLVVHDLLVLFIFGLVHLSMQEFAPPSSPDGDNKI